MLTAEQTKTIAGLLKIDEAKLTAAIKAPEETKIDIPEGLTVLTEAELTNVKNSEYGNGKVKGVEIAVKETKEKLGIEFQGKSVDGLVEAAQKKALTDAKIAPDKKVAELEKDIAHLRGENATLGSTLKEKESIAQKAANDREIFRQVPNLGEGAPDTDIVLDLMRARGYDFLIEGGILVAKKGEDILKDKLAVAIPVKDVITNFAKEARLINGAPAPHQPGRGPGSPAGPAGVYSKLSEMKKDYEAQGKNAQGQEFMDKAIAYKTTNKDFDLNT